MKKEFAIFTIVQNEKYFLPKLIKYYTQYISSDDFYVLDHDSTDGSTDNLDVNVEKVSFEYTFDHKWMVNTVKKFQKKLLNDYKYVIFIEADDFLYTINDDFLQTLVDTFKRYDAILNVGYNIVHDYANTEKSSDFDLSGVEFMNCSLEKRKYWARKPNHDRALITKVPMNYSNGFHKFWHTNKNHCATKLETLYLAHLHTVDWKINNKRVAHRINGKTMSPTDVGIKNPNSHVFPEKSRQEKYFNNYVKWKKIIPTEHRDKMITLGI
jgi:hypothetical protein